MDDQELVNLLTQLKDTMVSVATGGQRIDNVNQDFRRSYFEVDRELSARGVPNTIPYADLWDWHLRWGSGDLPSYKSRRAFVSDIFGPLLSHAQSGSRTPPEPTGWARVDRTVGQVRTQLAAAKLEEHFQAIGLLCREALISLAQAVYDPERHHPTDSAIPSDTDANRMLDAYFAVELGGGSEAEARKHARSALALALALQHRRTASFRQAAMCVEATASVINVVAIAAGRRDP